MRPFRAGRVSPRGRRRGSETEAAVLAGDARGPCLVFAHPGGMSVSGWWERCFWAVVALPAWVSPGLGPAGLGSQVQVVGTEPARPVAAQGARWAPGSSRLHWPRTTSTYGVGLSTATVRRGAHPGPARSQVGTLLPRDLCVAWISLEIFVCFQPSTTTPALSGGPRLLLPSAGGQVRGGLRPEPRAVLQLGGDHAGLGFRFRRRTNGPPRASSRVTGSHSLPGGLDDRRTPA